MKIQTVILIAVGLLIGGCAAARYAPQTQLKQVSKLTLPPGLSETSGLFCQPGGFVTINDSGNLALIHTLDEQGNMLSSLHVRHSNTDWEAITLVNDTYLVADIGNNRGKRDDLVLIPVARNGGATLAVKPVSYAANTITFNQPYAHDFDAEAMTAADGYIYLFSKSWATQVASVYRFTLNDELSAMQPHTTVAGLPGVITGADWDKARQQFVVVGYLSDPFGNFDAFIARLDKDFQVLETWPLPDYKQVEGICVSDQGDYWITQEAGDNSPAVLAQFRLSAS